MITFTVTPHDVSPEAALLAIRAHDGPLLLDLDETLYLRNSTEDFLDCARPAVLALVLLRCLDAARPWRWTGGEATRDVWRVRLVRLCLPWTGLRWRSRVAGLAGLHANRRLITAIAPGQQAIVTTVGFDPIVTPLVAALGLSQARIVSARLDTCRDRRVGKLRLALDALGAETVERALVLTDSEQDLPLLAACATPLRAIWPEARLRLALGHAYLPGQYLTHVKRPGARYIVRSIVQDDLALWWLSSVALAASPLFHALGLALLLASFWCIYERGYVDNDQVAAKFEAEPKLSDAYASAPVATPRLAPWLWAAGLAVPALWLLRLPGQPTLLDAGSWAAVLLVTHWTFRVYNRFDKGTRVWLFALLQLARSAAFIAIVPVAMVGALAVGAQVMAKWVPYYVYRLGGAAWPAVPFHLVRLLFFLLLLAVIGGASGLGAVATPTTLALGVWFLYRARTELATALRGATRIDRGGLATRETLP